jgi:hypothetical protein
MSRFGLGMDWHHMSKIVTPRWGWALTGSGHFFNEGLGPARELEHFDRQQGSKLKEFLARRGSDLAVA